MSKSFQEKQQDTRKKIAYAKWIEQVAFIIAVTLCVVLMATAWLDVIHISKGLQEILGLTTLGCLLTYFVSRFTGFYFEGKLVSK